MTSIQAFQQVMSPVSSVGQVTYLRDRHRTMGPPLEQKTVKKSGEKQEIRRYGYKAIASAPYLSTSQQNTLHAHARKKRQLSWPLAPYETSTNLARVPYQKTTMSDRREVQTKPLIILRKAEDYPK